MKHCTKNQQKNIREGLLLYLVTIPAGKFNRQTIRDETTISISAAEGKWHAEINRRKKYGDNYDWKT